jgi:hypothetical protein
VTAPALAPARTGVAIFARAFSGKCRQNATVNNTCGSIHQAIFILIVDFRYAKIYSLSEIIYKNNKNAGAGSVKNCLNVNPNNYLFLTTAPTGTGDEMSICCENPFAATTAETEFPPTSPVGCNGVRESQ